MKQRIAFCLLLLLIMPNCTTVKRIDSTKMTEITILSKGQLGFRTNSGTYRIGMDINDFISNYGRPCRTEKDTDERHKNSYLYGTTSYYFYNDGLIVTSKDNKVIGIIFYMVKSDNFEQSRAITQEGIGAGLNENDILGKLGKPYKVKTLIMEPNWNDRDLYYRYGNLIISYEFSFRKFTTIAMNAELIPFLEKL